MKTFVHDGFIVTMNITKSDHNNLAKDTRKKWHYTRVNCVSPKPDPMAELTSSVNSSLKTISS